MAYDSDDISDKLKSLKGSSLSDFSQEDLDMMWKEGLTSPAKIGDNWDEQGPRSYSLMYGEDEWEELQNEIDYGVYGNEDRKYGPRAGVQDLFEAMGKGGKIGELTDDQKTWQKASEALGISKVDSENDIRQLRGAVQREMMGRFAMAGGSGMAKDEDVAAPATTGTTESDTLRDAKANVKRYRKDVLPKYGDKLFSTEEQSQPNSFGFGDKMFDARDNSSPADDKDDGPKSKDYLNAFKFNVANKMKPVDLDGSDRSSIVQKFKDKQKQKGLI